jgi:hypothetical protein
MQKLFGSQRFLVIYSAIVTVAFAVTVLGGFAAEKEKTSFGEITVQRINVVEPDGTLRLVISDKAMFPGIFIKNKEHPHPNNRKTAGMLFFNDEGTENGGLTFGGEKDKNGKPTSQGHLSFDAYEQDQSLTFTSEQKGDQYGSAITVVDRPSYPIEDVLALTDRIKNLPPEQQKAEAAKFNESHPQPHRRLVLGRDADKSVALKLKDVDGRDRMILEVAADGSPRIRVLDASGSVVSEWPTPKGK